MRWFEKCIFFDRTFSFAHRILAQSFTWLTRFRSEWRLVLLFTQSITHRKGMKCSKECHRKTYPSLFVVFPFSTSLFRERANRLDCVSIDECWANHPSPRPHRRPAKFIVAYIKLPNEIFSRRTLYYRGVFFFFSYLEKDYLIRVFDYGARVRREKVLDFFVL